MASLWALQIVGCYIGAHLVIGVAAALLSGLRAFSTRARRPVSYQHLLLIGRLLTLGALCLPLMALWHGSGAFAPVRVQVWSAPSMYASTAILTRGPQVELGIDSARTFLAADMAALVAMVIFAGGLLLTLPRLVPDARATFHAIRTAHPLRSMGWVRLRVSDTESVPFAAWIPGRCFIVVPAALLLRPADLRLAIRHEALHHRHRDVQFLYSAVLARALFGLNPALHFLLRQLTELQELACDEAIAGRPGHRLDAYCGCLLRIAEAAAPVRGIPLRSCMASRAGTGLALRIRALMRGPLPLMRAPAAAAIGFLSAALLVGLSVALAVPVADRRLSRAAVEELAGSEQSSADDLVVNDDVVRQLNLLLGTPDGREFLRGSIGRMSHYAPSVTAALEARGLPLQLLAVPLVESGYRNLPAHPGAGAGLWMFIAPTARHYGLQISAGRDQRLDVPAETMAATQMLWDLWRKFDDWPLALMAYNSGASRVEAGIRATQSRDAWTLYRAGFGNDPHYLARTTAVMLILKHPDLTH